MRSFIFALLFSLALAATAQTPTFTSVTVTTYDVDPQPGQGTAFVQVADQSGQVWTNAPCKPNLKAVKFDSLPDVTVARDCMEVRRPFLADFYKYKAADTTQTFPTFTIAGTANCRFSGSTTEVKNYPSFEAAAKDCETTPVKVRNRSGKAFSVFNDPATGDVFYIVPSNDRTGYIRKTLQTTVVD